jgi:MFS family permease
MAVGYLVIACGFALNWFAHTIPALVACMVVFTVGEMITMPMASAYIAGLAPANLRGRYLGVSGLTWSVSLIVGPAAGLKLFAWNPAVYFAAFGSLGLLAAAIITTPVKPREIAAIIPAKAEV